MNSAGHPFGPGPVATISENSPRADAWRTIFGGLTAPIKSAVPQRRTIEQTVTLVYWLDIGRIDSGMLDTLVVYTMEQFAHDVHYWEVRERLLADGMPIKADDVSVVTNEHPEEIIAGLDAEIAKASADLRNSVGMSDIRDKLDMRPTLDQSMHEPARYDVPPGASIGDVSIPAGNMTAQQVADLIGGTAIGPGTILGPSLAMHSAKSSIVRDEQDIRAELSDSDGSPPSLCSCLADGTPRGPHCVHAREWLFRQDDGLQRVRKHGGAPTCPRVCVDCTEGAHHFCEIDMRPVFDLSPDADGEYNDVNTEELEYERKHPAHLAGCESWYECRHCDAWIEASEDDDMPDDEDDDSSTPLNECDKCGEDYAECECDPDSDDYGPDSDDDEDESPHNEPGPHPNTQDVSSMVPANDRQAGLLDVGPPVRPAGVPCWATNMARELLHAARLLGLFGTHVPNSVAVHWSAVILDWPNDVVADVHKWLNTPQEAAQSAKDNVPTAVRALVDQANAGGEW